MSGASTPQRPRVSWLALCSGLLVVLPLLWVLLRGLSLDPHHMDAPLIGKPAPSFSLKRLEDDQPLTLADLRGKPVVLNFWATWCIPCRTEHPVLVAGARSFSDKAQFVGIVYQDRKTVVNEWLDAFGGQAYPIGIDIDGKVAIAYGVYGVPETYFINSQGVVENKFIGPLSMQELAANLEQLK